MHPVATWRGLAVRAISIALFGLVGAAGCTMVGESLTGVSLNKQKVENCIKGCNEQAGVAMESEQRTHHENVEACLELSDGAKEACLDAEGGRHSAAVEEIQDGRKDCKGNCHHQGRGNAG